MRNPNIKESKPHSYIRWWEISEAFKFNAEILKTVKGYRNVLCCLWKLGVPGPKHMENKAAEKAICQTWEGRMGGFFLYTLPPFNSFP